jgi:pyruvate dehydrogenase E2 component (dihydrolipoamide acetyltransferase)
MATPLRMPDLGTVEGEVTLVRWLKAEGDTVTLGEPLFEVETDKGVSEVEAAMAGVLVKRLVAAGARAGSGEPIALIRRPGEPEEAAETARAAPTAAAGTTAASVPSAVRAPGRPYLAPVIRALAEKWGEDLSAVRPTGPGGRVTREDVLKARDAAGPRAPAPARQVPASTRAGPAPAAGPARLTSNQAAVARTVTQSWREKPVFHVHARVDMTMAIELRMASKAGGPGAAGAVSWDAILIKACAAALSGEPLFRRYFKADELLEHVEIDVAVAVGVGDDLFVPAVRGAAGKTVPVISREIDALAQKAEARALTAQDVDGSCFLVSNLGMFPVESFDAIVYPEHSAALAVGATTPTPVSDGKNTWIAPLARLTLTVDHRVINGRTAARFLARVKQIIETGAFS